MKKIQAVIFDMDGLMFDTERLVIEAWIQAGNQTGCPITKALAMETLGKNEDDTSAVFMKYFGADYDFQKACSYHNLWLMEHIEKHGVPIKPGLIELLSFLKTSGYKTAVATASAATRTEYYLRKTNLRRYFYRIVCNDMVERGKPNPDLYIKASELLNIPPADCLVLEDSPVGILAASRAGMKPVMIPDLVQPDEDTARLLYGKAATLFDVIALFCNAY